MKTPDPSVYVKIADIVHSADLAHLFGVSPAAVSNWKRRHDDFPEPFKILPGRAGAGHDGNARGTSLYRRSELLSWYVRHYPERVAAARALIAQLGA